MSKTVVADVIVPEMFTRYAMERTAALSAFYQSGIVERTSGFDALANGGGSTVDMPFWQDLTPERQILSGSNSLIVNKITASKDIARIQNDAQTWSSNDLVGFLTAEDPMAAIGEFVAGYWARTDQTSLLAALKGVFAAASMSSNLHAIHSESIAAQSASTRLNGSTFVDASALLGDSAGKLTAVAMHSAVEASLRKQELIDSMPDSEGRTKLETFQGRQIIVDDAMPSRAGTTDGTVYTTYLFGTGAFAQGNANLDSEPLSGGFGTKGVELSREALASDSVLINRRRYILHPRGVKFNSAAVVGESPTNAELETAANWTRVWEAKNVRIVAVTHNV